MIETKCNYKGNYKNNLKCEICKIDDDKTEHLLECKLLNVNNENVTANDIKEANIKVVSIIQRAITKREKMGYKVLDDEKEVENHEM